MEFRRVDPHRRESRTALAAGLPAAAAHWQALPICRRIAGSCALPPSLQIARPACDVASQVLVVTGMHRSGTSLVSNLLQSAGVHVGDNLIAANVANPRGYFEDVDFYEFHERMLHRRGETYLYATGNSGLETTAAELQQARDLIAARTNHRIWGWKDPRTALFLDFWSELLPQARYVFVYRHPMDVLLSLLRRGEFDEHPNLSAGLQAWQSYNAKIAEFFEKHAEDCLLVHIDSVVSQIDQFAQLLQEKLHLDFQLSQEAFDQIFHENELRNTPLPKEAEQLVGKLYPELNSLYYRLNASADLPPSIGENTGEPGTAGPRVSDLALIAEGWSEPISESARQSALQLMVSVLAPDRTNEMLARFNGNAKGLQQKVDTMWLHAQQLERNNNMQAELIRTQQDEIGSRQQVLEQQQAQISSQFDQAATLQSEFVSLNCQLATQQNELETQRCRFETQQNLLVSQQNQLAWQQTMIDLQQTQIDSQHTQIIDRDQVLNQQSTRIGAMLAELGGVHETIFWKLSQSTRNVKERIWKTKPMSSQVYQGGLPSPIQGNMAERIAQVRELQAELRLRPVTGSMRGLKKAFFQVVRSTFSRQFTLNTVTVDLIESLYRDLERLQPQLASQSHQLQQQAHRSSPPGALIVEDRISTGEVLASCGMTQDQAKLNNIRPLQGFNHVYTSPAELRMPERVALYSVVFGLQPKNCLEIGTFRGGSTAIIWGAMNDSGFGQLTCVDPMPNVDPKLWSQLSSRCRMFEGPSPDILPEVGRQVGKPFDFAFIDANHTYDFVKRDITGVLPLMANSSYLLFHDANYPDVKKAIDESVSVHAGLTDCGLISVEPTVLQNGDQQVTWAGLRLLKFQRPNV